MSDSSPLPPVRLHSEAELARDALATPLLSRAVRLARWAGPDTRVGAGGELVEEQLPGAAAELGLEGEDAAAYASEAWRVAVDTGLVEIVDEEEGTVAKGAELALVSASTLPGIRAVVALAPTDAVQQGVMRNGQSRAQSSWSFRGADLPFLVQKPSRDFDAQFRNRPPYRLRLLYEASRADSLNLDAARIPLEKFNGRLLLVSGRDDQMIPSSTAAEAIVRRLGGDRATHLQYEDAGHVILPPYLPTPPRWRAGIWLTGGTPEGVAEADVASWKQILGFLDTALR